MDEAKKIIDEMNRTFESFKERNDTAIAEMETRNGQATSLTTDALNKNNAAITELRGQLKEIELRVNRPVIPAEGAMSPEKELEVRAYNKYCRYGLENEDKASWAPEEKRALTSASDGTGGFLVPISYEGGIIMNAYNAAELRPICQVSTTGRDTVQLGALSKPTVAWGHANIAITEQSLTAGKRTITIYKLQALTLIAVDTLEDAEANLESELNAAFGRAIAEAEDDAFSIGVGDNEPRGVVGHAGVQALYVASGIAAALSNASNNGVDKLITCMHTPKKTYRRNGTWAFNSTTEAVIRSLKDGEGRYIWQPNTQVGTPPSLLGRPIVNPEGMADIGANTYPIVFGDFNAGYKIRDRKGITMQRLVERYAEYDQVGFKVTKRTGGDAVLVEAFCPIKIAAS
ncbi:MAG: phage major capsid protein [bacterium]|nr:phage major capsid protein [bacterium]